MSAAGKSVNSLPRGNPQVGLSSLQFHPWSSETLIKKNHSSLLGDEVDVINFIPPVRDYELGL
jgi:hypothetical protein